MLTKLFTTTPEPGFDRRRIHVHPFRNHRDTLAIIVMTEKNLLIRLRHGEHRLPHLTIPFCLIHFFDQGVFFKNQNILFQRQILAPFPKLLQSPINAGAFCMLAGLVIVPLVSLATKAPDAKLVEDAFSCSNKRVLVPQSEALGDSEDPTYRG